MLKYLCTMYQHTQLQLPSSVLQPHRLVQSYVCTASKLQGMPGLWRLKDWENLAGRQWQECERKQISGTATMKLKGDLNVER